MLNDLKNFIARVMRVPPEPHDPMGDVQSLRVFRASKQYLYYRYLSWAGGQFLVLLFAGVPLAGLTAAMWSDRTVERWIPLAIGIVGASFYFLQLTISFFMVWLDYEMRWYKITDRSLRIRHGIWRSASTR